MAEHGYDVEDIALVVIASDIPGDRVSSLRYPEKSENDNTE